VTFSFCRTRLPLRPHYVFTLFIGMIRFALNLRIESRACSPGWVGGQLPPFASAVATLMVPSYIVLSATATHRTPPNSLWYRVNGTIRLHNYNHVLR